MLYNLPQNQEISNRYNKQTKKKHSTSHSGWDTKFSQHWKLRTWRPEKWAFTAFPGP